MIKNFDWSQPQRQPLAGLVVVFLNLLWEVVKRAWPILILMLLRNKPGKIDTYEILALVFVGFTVVGALAKFFFFRFYIEEEKLLVRSGWFTKKQQVVPLERIQTVQIEQGPLHQALGIVKLAIDTAGSEKAEVTINALHKPMAEALRARLLSSAAVAETKTAADTEVPLIRLSSSDLLKLSVSANHLETLALLISFGLSMYENLKQVAGAVTGDADDYLGSRLSPTLFLLTAVLIITLLISTARIFFSYYQFQVVQVNRGFHIHSGLLHIKERLVAFRRIQMVSWKANWIRKLLGLWLLELHVTGGDQVQRKARVQLPVTRQHFIPMLAQPYAQLPETNPGKALRIHWLYLVQRSLIFGVLPAAIVALVGWLGWGWAPVYLALFPVIVAFFALLRWFKFRLWCFEEVLLLKKGLLGEEWVLLHFSKVQSVHISEPALSKHTVVATLRIHTAAGVVLVPFVNKNAAVQLMDYVLFRLESSSRPWM